MTPEEVKKVSLERDRLWCEVIITVQKTSKSTNRPICDSEDIFREFNRRRGDL
jgi:hypothetical protein